MLNLVFSMVLGYTYSRILIYTIDLVTFLSFEKNQ